MGLFYYHMKKVKSVNLYHKIEYQDSGEYSTMDNEGKFTPEPEGWYYTGMVYQFKDNLDLSKDFGTPFSELAVEDNDDITPIVTQQQKQSLLKQK